MRYLFYVLNKKVRICNVLLCTCTTEQQHQPQPQQPLNSYLCRDARGEKKLPDFCKEVDVYNLIFGTGCSNFFHVIICC